MERKRHREESPLQDERAEAGKRNPLPDEHANETLLEDFLDHLIAPLVGVVPFDVRRELRAEMREHLLARAAAYEELGSSRSEAVREALTQFGDPQAISREWLRVWKGAEPVASPIPATITAFSAFGLASCFSYLLWLTNPDFYFRSPSAAGSLLLMTALPLLVGLVIGLYVRARAALGTFFGLAALVPPLMAFSYMIQHDFLFVTVIQLPVVWMPIGCIAAQAGAWLRERSGLARRWSIGS